MKYPYLYQIINEAVFTDGANIINNSWKLIYDNGAPGRYSTLVRMAFANAYKNNVIAVASSGNTGYYGGGNFYQYPAGFGQGIIAVGATDNKDEIAHFSTYQNYVDVSAPGVNILSTVPNSGFLSTSGTSMSTPIVSGIASLLKGYKPSLENDDIENIIRISAEDKGDIGWDVYYGTGRVNARKALDYLRAPYSLYKYYASGGSVYGSTGTYQLVMFGVPGLADGVYFVKRHEVRKTINVNPNYVQRYVWGRGLTTTGFSSEEPNYGMGFCDSVSSTATTATLRSYVYEVWNFALQYLGYYPTTPANVSFKYTILYKYAPLSLNIVGPGNLMFKEQGTWNADVNGGSGSRTYQWYKSSNGTTWTAVGTAQTFTTTMIFDDFYLKCNVTDSQTGWTVSKTKLVEYGLPIPKENNDEEIVIDIPDTYMLGDNYPNPFNPSTEIKYQLKESGFVSLKIYDILGNEVADLVNEHKDAGYYTAKFNGNNLASGIYIYRLRVNDFVSSKKMLLAK